MGVVVGVVGEILSQEVASGASKRAINNPMRETRTFKTVIVNMNRNNRGVILGAIGGQLAPIFHFSRRVRTKFLKMFFATQNRRCTCPARNQNYVYMNNFRTESSM